MFKNNMNIKLQHIKVCNAKHKNREGVGKNMKCKKILAIGFSILLFSITVLTTSLPVQAACSHGNAVYSHHILSGGVGNYGSFRRYFYLVNLNDLYSGYARTAVTEWVNTTSGVGVTTSISIRETTTQSSSVFDLYNYNNSHTSVLGYTEFYTYSTSRDPSTQNWGWSRIYLNGSVLAKTTAAQRRATIAHEFGHAMGLIHRNSAPTSIMCQLASGRTATRASASDCGNINHLYN